MRSYIIKQYYLVITTGDKLRVISVRRLRKTVETPHLSYC